MTHFWFRSRDRYQKKVEATLLTLSGIKGKLKSIEGECERERKASKQKSNESQFSIQLADFHSPCMVYPTVYLSIRRSLLALERAYRSQSTLLNSTGKQQVRQRGASKSIYLSIYPAICFAHNTTFPVKFSELFLSLLLPNHQKLAFSTGSCVYFIKITFPDHSYSLLLL